MVRHGAEPSLQCVRQWFRPNPRQGDRQHTCGSSGCKREWHRRACGKWHKENPGYDQHTRLVNRLVKEDPPAQRVRQPNPLNSINWALARDEIGLKVSVLVEETGKVLLQRARDAIPT